MDIPTNITPYLSNIRKMDSSSHKGQNGKVMVIGGSDLFHAASRWALDVVSAMVDMVFYSSVPENNELIREAKQNFWSGVVVPRGEIESYIQEADVVLIGPGMTRQENSKIQTSNSKFLRPTPEQWNNSTDVIINYLLSIYPEKKWVIDAGALQMVKPELLNEKCIVTPHYKELEMLIRNLSSKSIAFGDFDEKLVDSSDPFLSTNLDCVEEMSYELGSVTLLVKGVFDYIAQPEESLISKGGNPGLTKGGTGDVLAGLVAGLYAFTDDPFAAAVIGSFVNKKAGDELYEEVGPFFTTNQLVEQIPKVLKQLLYS